MRSGETLETQILPQLEAASAPIASAAFAAGRYEMRHLLGRGGQKEVYLARDNRLDRDVVISLLRTEQLDEKSMARLWREAQAMARLGDHPNIVTVFDFGDEAGRPYIVSQYVEGGSVADLLERLGRHPLSVKQVLQIGGQICQALTYAHSRGIIHRDLKPANIWLTRDNTAMLGDFGLAMGLDFSRITEDGLVLGTVSYMSPEQLLGQQAEPRSDLYSLGAMLYEMATGRPPFLGDELVAIVSQHINSQPVAPSWYNPQIPQALEHLILWMLEKAPAGRPDSAAAVSEALASIASPTGATAELQVKQDAKSLARLAGGVFVGREREIAELHSTLRAAISGTGQIVMLVGEPGSGKTTIADQLATYARLCGAQVLVGRCYEGEGAPAFWPWVQIIRSYAHESDDKNMMAVMGPGASAICQMVSEIREQLPDLSEPIPLEPKQARFRLFDSVTTFLKNASRAKPLMVVLDDLHWADKPSLLLLEFLAREIKDSRLLIVGTYRDMELGRHHPLAQTLGELARQKLSNRITLRGLNEPDVLRFIELTAGFEPADQLAAAVYKETEGNPFFVNEVVSMLVAEGRLDKPGMATSLSLRIPEGVREVIGRRLDHLSEQCNQILTIASVVGRDFSVDILEPLSNLSDEQLLELLEGAAAVRVIVEVHGSVGHYSFSHGLIRETLYEELSITRRVRLHSRIGEVLETLYKKNLQPHLAELAYHFFQAAAGGDTEKAIDYAVRAAEYSTTLLAYEEAAGHYERAIQALELKDQADQERQCELLLQLGDAHKKAGNTDQARTIFQQAAELARRLRATEKLTRAALELGTGVAGAIGNVDEVQVSLLKEALSAMGDEDSPLRAKVLAHLSIALYYSPELRMSYSQQSVEMARRVGDPTATVVALYSRHAALAGSQDLEQRLADATELLRFAEASGNKEMELRAHYRRILDLLELGDIPAADASIERYACLAEELRQPRYFWATPFFRASRALLEGRFEQCERLGCEALAIGRRAQEPAADLFFGVQRNILQVLQGRAEEQVVPVKAWIEMYPMIPGNWATLAYIYSNLRLQAEARSAFEKAAANDFADLPRDGSWITVLASLSYTCHFLDDTRRAEKLYELLLPYAGRNIVTGSAPVCVGSTSLGVALLATTMTRWEEAANHFENAIAMNTKIGGRPFVAESKYSYAAMLARQGVRNRGEALGLLEEALATAEELGMIKLIENARNELERIANGYSISPRRHEGRKYHEGR